MTALLVVALVLEPRAARDGFVVACLTAVCTMVALVAAWHNWWGGHSYGPRLLSEIQPLVLLALGVAVAGAAPERRRRALVAALVLLLPLQALVQALGTYGPRGAPPAAVMWNAAPVSVDVAPERNWDVADGPIARGLRAALAR